MPRVTAKGTRIYIGGFGSLTSEAAWTLIGDIVNFGEVSEFFQEVVYSTLEGIEHYEKGAKASNPLNVEAIHDDADDGQNDLEAAAADETADRDYNFRVLVGPQPVGTGLAEGIIEFKAKVFSFGRVIGDNSGMVRVTAPMRVKVNSVTYTPAVTS
jgi:hypothetical protein